MVSLSSSMFPTLSSSRAPSPMRVMRVLISLLLLAMHSTAQTAASVASPPPRFSLGVCGSTFSDITDTSLHGHTVSLIPGTSGISVITDPERGYCLSRSSSASAGRGVLISSSHLGASYTKSIWVKLSAVVVYPHIWSSYGGSQKGSHFLLIGNKGDIFAGHNQNGTQHIELQDYQPVGGNIWTHVVVTFDSTTQTMSIYQNGVVTTSKIVAAPGAPWDGSNSLPSQLLSWNPPYSFIGCVADINLYDSVLSADDVSNLYTTQLATTVCGTSVMADNKPIVPIPASAGIPPPQLSLGVCGATHPDSLSVVTDVVDVTGHQHAVTLVNSVSGVSLADSSDPVRGLAMTVGSGSGPIPITNSHLGSSYTVSAWVRLAGSLSSWDWPYFVASQEQPGGEQGEQAGAFALLCNSASRNSLGVMHVPDKEGGRRHLDDWKTAGPLPNNTWIHVAATFNGTSNMFALYRNGVQTATGAAGNPAMWNASNSINLQLAYFKGKKMQGQITDVTIWDSALTPTQMSKVHTRQSAYSVCDPATNGEETDDEWCSAMASSYGYTPADWACYSSNQCYGNGCSLSYGQRFQNTDLPGGPSNPVISINPSDSASSCQSMCFYSNIAHNNNCQSWVWNSNNNLCYTKAPRQTYDYGTKHVSGHTAGRICPQHAIAPETVATSLKDKWLTKCITYV